MATLFSNQAMKRLENGPTAASKTTLKFKTSSVKLKDRIIYKSSWNYYTGNKQESNETLCHNNRKGERSIKHVSQNYINVNVFLKYSEAR